MSDAANHPALPTLAPGGSRADAVRQLQTLLDEMQRTVDGLSDDLPRVGGVREDALSRILAGSATSADEYLLGASARGARLLVAAVPPSAAIGRLADHVTDSSRIVVTPAPAQLAILVLSRPRRVDDDRCRWLSAGVAKHVLRETPTAHIGISSPITTAGHLRHACGEAVEAAKLGRHLRQRTVFADEYWARLATMQLTRSVPRFLALSNPLSRIARYDQAHGSELGRTVGTWLRNNCDTAVTAKELSIHPNTLRYRLRRASDVSGLSLDDPDARLVTQLLFGTPR